MANRAQIVDFRIDAPTQPPTRPPTQPPTQPPAARVQRAPAAPPVGLREADLQQLVGYQISYTEYDRLVRPALA